MKVWCSGKFIDMEIGQPVFVGHCGSGHSVFGEPATLERATERHLVFRTESGKTIKTDRENLHRVIGKAGQQGNFVSPYVEVMKSDHFYKSPLFVW